jgi:hypothetical protein
MRAVSVRLEREWSRSLRFQGLEERRQLLDEFDALEDASAMAGEFSPSMIRASEPCPRREKPIAHKLVLGLTAPDRRRGPS